MNSTMKTSGCFSKSRGLRASIPFHFFALVPFFTRPECENSFTRPEFICLAWECLLRRLRWYQFWSKVMTSEVEQRPRLVTFSYRWIGDPHDWMLTVTKGAQRTKQSHYVQEFCNKYDYTHVSYIIIVLGGFLFTLLIKCKSSRTMQQ